MLGRVEAHHLKTLMSYLLLRDTAWGPPIGINLETINVCNIHCRHCRHSEGRDHFIHGKGTMPLERFQELVDKLPVAWHRAICVLGRDGEPLMNERLEDYARYYADHTGTAPCLATNGTLLTRERSAGLLDAGVREVRCDFCADADHFNRMRQGARWDEVLDNLRGFLEVAAQKGIDARLYVGDIHADMLSSEREQVAALRATRQLFEGCPGTVRIYKIVLFSSFGYFNVKYANPARYTYCHEPWINFVVDFAGRAVACCRDLRSEYILGDVFDEGFEALWNGPRMKNLRRALKKKNAQRISACAKCDMPFQGGFTGSGHPIQRVMKHGGRLVARRVRQFVGRNGDLYW